MLHGTFYMEHVDQVHTQHRNNSCRSANVRFSYKNLEPWGEFQGEHVQNKFKSRFSFEISATVEKKKRYFFLIGGYKPHSNDF